MPDLDDLFEKIVSGEIPSHKVYEDEDVFAFLDVNPLSRGHTLVIPRRRYKRMEDLPAELGAAIGRVLPKIAGAVVSATGAPAYNILVNVGSKAGQVIPHVHFHIIPRYEDGTGLGISWPARPIDKEDAVALADQICAALG